MGAYGADMTLGHSSRRLLITAYNLTGGHLRLFRTGHDEHRRGDDHLLAASVARATAAAPTYFKAAEVDDSVAPYTAVDGGVRANCPALVAICEATDVLKIPLDRIDVLSIGTTETADLIGEPEVFTGMLGWASRAPELMIKAQMQSALDHAGKLLPGRFLRIDDVAPGGGLDDICAIQMLRSKGSEIAAKQHREVKSRFLLGPAVDPWRPPPRP